ncbi:Amine sulfotransferase [Collichthys lucidus]|uniref:Sulfotransferase n=1 Tax=Collichthys lucidus TaxID=240159 RepID=A0A4U5V2Z9_COLLU|nr:Amine sulfotransferase [Collichthys lucidus]
MLTCEICGEENLMEEDMKTHLLLSHLENNMHCPLCSLSGVSYDELCFHISSAHPETPHKEHHTPVITSTSSRSAGTNTEPQTVANVLSSQSCMTVGSPGSDLKLARQLQQEEEQRRRQEEAQHERVEFKKLQRQFGLDSRGGYSRQMERTMERAVSRGLMAPTEFHCKRAEMMESLASGVDDGNTRTQGHSRSIVGLEQKKNGSLCLLLLDPGSSVSDTRKLLSKDTVSTAIRQVRKFPGSLKHKQYQVVVVRGVLSAEERQTLSQQLVPHKGFKLINGTHDPDDVDQIYNLEIRDSDVGGALKFSVFLGALSTEEGTGLIRTIWMQQILLLFEAKGDVTAISKINNYSSADLIPWIEVNGNRQAFITAPSPRLRVTHLQHHFMPAALSQRKGKVIYVARNPKDVLVSYFYFHKVANMLETPKDFDDFFEKFMRGDVYGCSWFDHIKTWYSHKDDMNMLFITYEEMIQDLHSAVQKISVFLGKELTDEQLANVVKHSTFNNMKKIPQASYEQVPGTIGDWKNHFTVAQNERFNEVFQREMKDFALSFIWDIKDIENQLLVS